MPKTRLYNTVDRNVLKQQLQASAVRRTTLSFYRYMPVDQLQEYRDHMYATWEPLGALGRIYVADEGVNGQISIPTNQITVFIQSLNTFGLKGARLNFAIEDNGKSFFKLKIKIRPKLVADGLQEGEIDWTHRGKHLSAAEFNALTDQSNTTVVDMRNHYESEVGHFESAICPDVETFRESLPIIAKMFNERKDQPIVMYCTGGIRCEKASAYLKAHGFEDVYQLDGGIIEYARQVERQGLKNKFRGKNFVFDERMGEHISEEVIAHCHQCGGEADSHVNCANNACHILLIQCEACREIYHRCCSDKCADYIQLPEEERKERCGSLEFNGTKFGKGRYKAFRPESDSSTITR